MNKIKINAGALVYVLLVSFVLLLIILALFTRFSLSNELGDQNYQRLNAINAFQKFDSLTLNTNGYLIKKNPDIMNLNTTITNWGVWGILSQNFSAKDTFQRSILIGNAMYQSPNLTIDYSPRGLGVLGNTSINGWVKLNTPKIFSSFIGTEYYTGKSLEDVKVTSFTDNPDSDANSLIGKDLLDSLLNISRKFSHGDSLLFENLDTNTIFRSFREKPLIIYYLGDQDLILKNISLTGHIILFSKSHIDITSSADLNDCILLAPSVAIKKDASICAQIISSGSIVMEKKSVGRPPTSLVILGGTVEKENLLVLEEDVVLDGLILVESNVNSTVRINSKSIIKGLFQCNSSVSFNGSMYGFMKIKDFVLQKSGGVYSNILYNATVAPPKTPFIRPYNTISDTLKIDYVKILD